MKFGINILTIPLLFKFDSSSLPILRRDNKNLENSQQDWMPSGFEHTIGDMVKIEEKSGQLKIPQKFLPESKQKHQTVTPNITEEKPSKKLDVKDIENIISELISQEKDRRSKLPAKEAQNSETINKTFNVFLNPGGTSAKQDQIPARLTFRGDALQEFAKLTQPIVKNEPISQPTFWQKIANSITNFFNGIFTSKNNIAQKSEKSATNEFNKFDMNIAKLITRGLTIEPSAPIPDEIEINQALSDFIDFEGEHAPPVKENKASHQASEVDYKALYKEPKSKAEIEAEEVSSLIDTMDSDKDKFLDTTLANLVPEGINTPPKHDDPNFDKAMDDAIDQVLSKQAQATPEKPIDQNQRQEKLQQNNWQDKVTEESKSYGHSR